MKQKSFWLFISCSLGLIFFITACQTSSETPPLTPPRQIDSETLPLSPTPSPAPSATPTLTPTPTQTGTPTPSPTPTQTATITATPTPAHPLTIAYLRQQTYPPSEIIIEEQLANGANYFRYYVSYQSEGLKIYALLTIPFGEKPATGWPVVVFNHGFIPPDIYRTTERYIAYVDGFATNGYIVLRSDYRGHAFSEGEARGAYGEPGYVIDVLNAVSAMKAHPDADPNRIGMWGHSMGGYITLHAMVVDPDIRAGVIWAGVVGPYPNLFDRPDFDLLATPSATGSGRGRWRTELVEQFGTPEENPEFWNSISANTFLSDISGPLQIHHGTADESVPYSVSELLYGQLIGVGETVEFYGYPGDDHDITSAFSLAMQRSIQFFDRYVKGITP
ncbi:MAG: S9 family peptidase [Anaerolineales bacterium]|nr:S9 family peptidase [Anaerolineales bacterium]